MEHKTLSVELRKEFGKGPSRRFRSEGKIPAVIYGVKENISITVSDREFSKKFKTISENTIITLDFGKDHRDVLIKDYQDNIITSSIEHVDFMEIEQGKLLRTHVPIILTGTAPGVKEGGILVQKINEVEVECLPKDIPSNITVNLDGLLLGHSIHVSDMPEIKGVTLLIGAEEAIVVVSHPKEVAAETSEDEEETEAAVIE
jgi:large subunit ribosomal protein L25